MIRKISFATALFFLTGTATFSQIPVYLDESKPVEQRIEDALSRMTLDEKIAIIHAQSKFSSPGVKRLGFPDFWTDDGPHGVRPDVLWDEWVQAGQTNDSCVAFPALTCLAATWNPEMARRYGESLGEEAVYRGKSMILGPGVNINRTPLAGRNFEYMGEDPLLASRMVVPYIQGLQSKGVAACVKHYALNNDEEYRHQVNVIVSDRALHEIYLPAFKAAVTEGKVWGVMGAYNLYKNQHNSHNEILLNRILKHDWGFDGIVVSDWGGCHDTDEAVKNGLDLEMGSWTDGMVMGATNGYDRYYMALPYKRLIQQGKYSTSELDEKVRRLLRTFYRTTMRGDRQVGFLCSESHYEAALDIATEGIVLLKNDAVNDPSKGKRAKSTVLPIDITGMKRVLIVGENAIKMMTVGGGSSSLKAQKEILPLDGFKALAESLSPGTVVDYARGYVGDTIQSFDGVTVGRSLYESRSAEELRNEAVSKARQADCVIVFGGLNKSDYQDCEGHDRKEMGLPYGQDELVAALVEANPRLVFVNISGNAVSMPWIDKVPAVVQGWFIGSESGEALAAVLTGQVNPSGKLPFTWYSRLEDCGAHALGTYPGVWRAGHDIIDEEYREDIYVGYRWSDSHKESKPLFAFGHGLSYTSFQLGKAVSDRQTMKADDEITFTVSITNTGGKAGSEVVQLYISDLKSSLPRPVKELKGFRKVYLEPSQTKEVSISIGRDELSYYDDSIQDWVAERGQFEALIGTSSDKILSKVKFTLE
ncbi:MAG: glycoside hydrolase family 3 C-terminal domain-containing protein [Bacteroidaceae bacterium]|nr:glycoside hydrolase family 3 C-terminal domain-containing protein [Bacteroidaceae bacterium]